MKMSEAKLQAEFFKLVNNDPFFRYCIWSTPNDAFLGNDPKQRAIQANKLKATGLLKGVWDLTIQKNSKLFFIESKIGTNVLTAEQKHFRDVRIGNGVPEDHFFIYKTIDEGIEVLKKIKEICLTN